MLAFWFAAAVIIALGEVNRRSFQAMQKVQGEVEEQVQEPTAELDAAIFRSIQECLTNIHRHAKARPPGFASFVPTRRFASR